MTGMARYLYSIEVQKAKDDFEISLFKKGSQSPLFSIMYRNINKCERYAFVKNGITKSKSPNYEVVSCYYCRGARGTTFSAVRRMSRGRRKLVRIIKNSKNLHSDFKKTIKSITTDFSKFKNKKIGNLKIYSTNDAKIVKSFVDAYNSLHKIR